MKKDAIVFSHVSKSFDIARINRLKALGSFLFEPRTTYPALRDVSFTINKHETVGIFGPNGSGKSTILKLIAGILVPDDGSITVSGKVVPVLGLGTGLQPNVSGEENIYLYGTILGMQRKQINQSFHKIVEYSGLRTFIKEPVKKYSSGMTARLAFSIAIHSLPEILLIDEVLSVGDIDFQIKSLQTMRKLQKTTTIVFVSHNLSSLKAICDTTLSIYDGKIIDFDIKKMKQFLRMLPKTHTYSLPVISNSMMPTFSRGDTLALQRVPFSQLKIGDIIAYELAKYDMFITHRIVGKTMAFNTRSLITKGDSSPAIDPWLVTAEEYLGKAIRIKRHKKTTSLNQLQ